MSDAQEPLGNKPHTTPPQSFTASPLTPPSTNERTTSSRALSVLRYFKQIQTGRNSKLPIKRNFEINEGEFKDVRRQIQQDQPLLEFVEHRLQHEYDATSGQLTVCMPTSTHKVLIRRISNVIECQLEYVSQYGETESAREFAKQIEFMGSTTIGFTDPEASRSTYSPDASFKHRGARYPGIVVEVAYSQGSRSLSRRADDYVQWSNGSIRLIIGLKIEYGVQSRKASLSTWRAEIVDRKDGKYLETKQDLKEVAFRDDLGNSTGDSQHVKLEISLRDFANSDLTKSLGDVSETITITLESLCDALSIAEQPNGKSEEILPPEVRKRKRSSTPEH